MANVFLTSPNGPSYSGAHAVQAPTGYSVLVYIVPAGDDNHAVEMIGLTS